MPRGRPKGIPKTGGRKKGTPNKATMDIKAAASKYSEEALTTLAQLMRDAENEATRVSAAKEILDRAHGKATQHVEGNVTVSHEDALREIEEAVEQAREAVQTISQGNVLH